MTTTNFSPYSSSPEAKLERFSPLQSQSDIMPADLPAPSALPKSKAKPRKRVNTAEKRHQHNAVERQRRETLNSKFFVLARLLPSLAKTARPSKSAIVKGSIAHLTKQRDQRLLAARLLRQLCAERDELAKECNEWRAASGFAGGQENAATTAWTDEMDDVCLVEKETFGEFAEEGEVGDAGDDGEDQDQDEAMDLPPPAPLTSRAMGIEQATAAVSRFDTTAMGLITPRSSTDIDPLSLALGMSMPMHDLPTQGPEINWPSNFDFSASVPGLTAEPISITHPNALRASASMPFTTFMSESSSGSPTGSLLGSLPTPPQTSDFSQFTHTPSPRSSGSGSGSFEDKSHSHMPQLQQQARSHFSNPLLSQSAQNAFNSQSRSQWSQQDQLLFLHSLQQQQLQQQQLVDMHARGLGPSSPSVPFGRSQSLGSEGFAQNIHSASQSLPLYSAGTLQQMQLQQMLQQQQEAQQLHQQQMAAQAMSMSRNANMPNEQLEAWRKIAMGAGSGARAEFGMWAQNALKGY